MPDPSDRATAPPSGTRTAWALGLAVGLVAAVVFGSGVGREPHFPDESAYIAQAYFLDLLLEGRRDDWAWVEYHAYDLPPLPKYLIGLSLKVAGLPHPNRLAAGDWFRDIRRPLAGPRTLIAARWPSVLMGAIGCSAIFFLGSSGGDRRVGVLASALLMLDPLYRLHARRAMADASAEALILATAALGLWLWRRSLSRGLGRFDGLAGSLALGVLGGLAVLAKLNGGLGLMIVGAWAILGLSLDRFARRRRVAFLGLSGAAGAVSLATFVALNPAVTARPTGPPPPRMLGPLPADQSPVDRLRAIVHHRASVSSHARSQFPHDALNGTTEKVAAVAVQGFGRFGPLGPWDHDSLTPLPRYSWRRDRVGLIWGPWMVAGAAWAVRRGREEYTRGEPPVGWAWLVLATVSLATVTAFIPLAWDRYFLSIQAGAILLASGVAVAALDAAAGRLAGRPRVG